MMITKWGWYFFSFSERASICKAFGGGRKHLMGSYTARRLGAGGVISRLGGIVCMAYIMVLGEELRGIYQS